MVTKTKHLVSTTMHKMVSKTNFVVQTNWFKWSLLGVIVWLMVSKNVSFQISIGEKSANTMEIHQTDTRPQVVQTTMALDNPDTKTSPSFSSTSEQIKVTKTDNLANQFSNIAFVMNPTYAKKHGISAEIVAQKRAIVNAYVSSYVPIAKVEQNLYGIPTSITLAQGLLESDAGGSRLATQNNNHFGIKCFSNTCAKGHCKNFTDDTHKDFFLVHKSAWESYRAHSLFLQKPRYKHLLALNQTDYKGWAKGLSAAGYATDKRYADKLITLIEALELYKYDY
jgi:flagellum-specific peptidoglycan hydrolase FlgJ